jgi:hypothetical protein
LIGLRAPLCGLLALVAGVCAASALPAAAATSHDGQDRAGATTGARRAPAAKRGGPRQNTTSTAVGAKPAGAETSGAGEAESGPLAAPSEGDVLTENGLGSPGCREDAEASALARENCATSGFTAAPAPTGNYAFDVHIDTGLAHFSNYLEAAVQDSAQWGWMALVALVHGLLVALEWCYALNLLGNALLAEVAVALRGARATLTTPGLAVVLAIASMLAAYHGLLRRRVAQTLGQALAMLVMMVAGLWTIIDPAGSVGALATWVNRASVGALGALAAGTPAHPQRTLAEDMRGLFADAIGGPWCFLEFGNVRWCRDPRLLDPRLRRAALKIASQERTLAAGAATSAERRHALAVAALLESAKDNGELFLALPANGVARNSINESASLLSVLCGGSTEATRCSGPTAAEAQFRTQHGTWPRVVGLLLILIGALAMLALYGWIALRLLAAAVLSLLLLLLAPVAVLAPALGDGGRGMFRVWATRLFGAITAKLVYSLLLGATLLVTDMLSGLEALGWWMQWALIACGWWLAFHERRELLGLARVGESAPWSRGGARSPGPGASRPHGVVRRVRERALHRATDAAVLGAGRFARRVVAPPPRLTAGRRTHAHGQPRRRSAQRPDPQTLTTLEQEREESGRAIREAPQTQAALSASRAQLARVELAQLAAEQRLATGGGGVGERDLATRRRVARLADRARRIEGEIALRQGSLSAARRHVSESRRASEGGGRDFGEAQVRERARFLDAQARLPDKGGASVHGDRRDYRRMAALGGEEEGGWDELAAERRRRAILRIDRALATRERLPGAGEGTAQASDGTTAPTRPGEFERRFARAGPRDEGQRAGRPPPRTAPSSPIAGWLEDERRRARAGGRPPTLAERARDAAAAGRGQTEDADDARARRRRQFGRDQREGLDSS